MRRLSEKHRVSRALATAERRQSSSRGTKTKTKTRTRTRAKRTEEETAQRGERRMSGKGPEIGGQGHTHPRPRSMGQALAGGHCHRWEPGGVAAGTPLQRLQVHSGWRHGQSVPVPVRTRGFIPTTGTYPYLLRPRAALGLVSESLALGARRTGRGNVG